MGIKNLKKFLRQKYPQVMKQIHISEFNSEKIAIDISSYIYKYKVVFGENWLSSFPNLVCSLKKYNIHGNFIFDGTPPIEKVNEKNKRKNQKQNLEDNVMNVSFELDQYKQTQIPSALLISVMKKIVNDDNNKMKINRLLHSGLNETHNSEGVMIDIKAIEEYIRKKESQIVNISKEDINDVKRIFDSFGVPYIQAPGEAESLGAYFVNTNQCCAILTEDTDVLAYGVSTFLSDFNTSTGVCDVIYLKDILDELDFSHEQFLDFCIMCGTDYNDNIPNYSSNKVFDVISTYKSIEQFEQAVKTNVFKTKQPIDCGILNYTRTREIFKTYGNLEEISLHPSYWNNQIDLDELFIQLKQHRCRFSQNYIEELWSTHAELVFED